jgi:integrase
VARRALNRMSDRTARTASAGIHCDGAGLYLQVTEPASLKTSTAVAPALLSRSWLFRFATTEAERAANSELGRERWMGLGSFPDVSLAEARAKAADARRLRKQGHDPIASRDAQKATAAASTAKTITFEKAAEKYIAAHEAGWRTDTHLQQWTNSIKTYANPVIGHLAVRDIDTGLVMQVLEPIWTTVPETASRLRARIERVLGWAKVQGYREGENPARWADHISALLPARGKIRKVEPQKPFPALPYRQIGAFMAELREQEGVAARALEFAILCAGRGNEVCGAKWSEIAGEVWTVPASRTKGGREHRIPLSTAGIELIERMQTQRSGDYVFPGRVQDEPLSRAALSHVIPRINAAREARGLPRWTDPKQGNRDVVPHGFRSSFKDFASEATGYRDAVSEAALSHISADKVRLAYERTTFEQQRRELAEAWSQACASAPIGDNVVTLRSA